MPSLQKPACSPEPSDMRRQRYLMESIDPPVTVAAPDGAYSAAVLAGNLAFLAGQGPFDADGQRVGETITDQINRTLDNLEQVANAAGSSLDHVVRFGVYLNSMDD